ncbi:MAG: metallophosphoesterase [Actinomycetia bacterium]|nr:metallophosphoesterase [Actinomycetes bacterium]
MGFIAMGLLGLPCALVALVYYLGFAPRWRPVVRGLVVGAVALVVVVSMMALTLRRLPLNMDTWRPLTTVALTGLPVVAYTMIGLVPVVVADLVWRARSRRSGPAPSRPRRVGFLRWATCLVVALALGVTGFGWVRAHAPALTPVTIVSDQLPASFDGYRIALITDLHIGPGLSRAFLQQVVDETNAARPDLVVIAGDLVDGTVAELGGDLAPLAGLTAPDGVVVTTGNHEFYTGEPARWVADYAALGLRVLDNDGVVLTRGDASIDVLGVNDRTGTAPLEPDLALAAQRLHDATGVPVDGTGRFRILVAHEPKQVLDDGDGGGVPVTGTGLPARLGVDLALVGHTHGGQLWPLTALIGAVQPVRDGVHDLAGVTTVTSRGAGAWGPPVRVGAPPEIPLITLRTHLG